MDFNDFKNLADRVVNVIGGVMQNSMLEFRRALKFKIQSKALFTSN